MSDQTQPETPPVAARKRKNCLECALDAAVNAFVIVLLGKIAIGIIGGILSRMIPSLPPGLGVSAAPGEAGAWWYALGLMRYKFLYAIVFVICFRLELAQRDGASGATSRFRGQRIGQRLWENWFGSLVGNAFLAMTLAMVLAKIPDFSFWQWLWNWLQPARWLAPDLLNAISPWLDWYGHNKVRFNFWVLYLAAVSDDFGIPNFKSLARWAWRRGRGKSALKADRMEPSKR